MAKTSRNDESTDVMKITAPSYLAKHAEADGSIAELQQYRIVPRVTIVQAMSKGELKDKFGEGAVVLMPSRSPVAKAGESFLFLPILFFVEFTKWRDINDASGLAVLDRSFDPASDIAMRSKSPDRRLEPYGDKGEFKYRYVEALNFAGLILKPGENGAVDDLTPCALSFARGEHFNGQTFIGEIMKRRIGPGQPVAPLWSQIWRMRTETHRNKAGKEWKGFGFDVDSDRPWVTEDEAPKFLELHQQLAIDLKRKKLAIDQTDMDDSEIVDEPMTAATTTGPQEF